jgi:hypothetical protein
VEASARVGLTGDGVAKSVGFAGVEFDADDDDDEEEDEEVEEDLLVSFQRACSSRSSFCCAANAASTVAADSDRKPNGEPNAAKAD